MTGDRARTAVRIGRHTSEVSNPPRGRGQVALDLCLLVVAGILILTGLVLMQETQVYPLPGPRQQRQRFLTGGPPFVLGIVFAIVAVFRGHYRHMPSLFRRLLTVPTVAAAFVVSLGAFNAAWFGAVGVALLAWGLGIGLLVVAALLLKRS